LVFYYPGRLCVEPSVWYPASVSNVVPSSLPDFHIPKARLTALQSALAASSTPSGPDCVALARALRPNNPGGERERALDALASGAACVVTGQQAGLFGGPLYTVHKTLTAIAVARALTEESGHPVIPVFWLQSEDHDFPEIARTELPGGTSLEMTAAGHAAASVATRTLTAPPLDALRDALGTLPHAEGVVAQAARHYVEGASVTRAFAGLVAEWFDEVIIVDPRDPAIAALTAPTHAMALDRSVDIARALLGTAETIEESGGDVQVHVRPDAPLAFFHPDGPDGPRFRLEPDGPARWTLIGDGRTVTRDAIDAAVRRDPRHLSSSALLRPIIQDHLLPTATYIGGPGEARYYAQLPDAYVTLGRTPPMFVPRARLRFLDRRSAENLRQAGLTTDDLSRPWPELLTTIGGLAATRRGADQTPDAVAERLTADVRQQLTAFEAVAEGIDPGLVKATRRTLDSVEGVIGKLVSRYARAVAAQDEVTVARVERARNQLAPGGAPQERVFGLPWFAARYGLDTVLAAAREAVVPYDAQMKDVLL